MNVPTAAVLGVFAGVIVTALAMYSVRLSERERRGPVAHRGTEPPALPDGVGAVLAVLASGGIVLDASDAVVNTSPAAVASGLVRHGELVHAELLQLAWQVRRDGEIREVELELSALPTRRRRMVIAARVAPLGEDHVLLLVEDRSEARRLDQVRRDFVVNVSHELKTPVGGLVLLAEAVVDAPDDQVAVARFARRMQVESGRLARLVQEIVDFSRLQVAAPSDLQPVNLIEVAREAIDATRVAAEDKGIEVRLSPGGDAVVCGERPLLVTAVRNLIGNAIAYSGPHTGVAIDVREVAGHLVEVTVTDHGSGIPTDEQDRIFERFYRIDEARSRSTGGSGLGLAIVKHVAANHGGEVLVWSEPGEGATFTLRLPAASAGHDEHTDLPRPADDHPVAARPEARTPLPHLSQR